MHCVPELLPIARHGQLRQVKHTVSRSLIVDVPSGRYCDWDSCSLLKCVSVSESESSGNLRRKYLGNPTVDCSPELGNRQHVVRYPCSQSHHLRSNDLTHNQLGEYWLKPQHLRTLPR